MLWPTYRLPTKLREGIERGGGGREANSGLAPLPGRRAVVGRRSGSNPDQSTAGERRAERSRSAVHVLMREIAGRRRDDDRRRYGNVATRN